MKIYRLCRENEVKEILTNKSFENIGNYCKNSDKNTHLYDENTKYIHFFKHENDLLYLNTLENRFICVYDIPEVVLYKYYGEGSYLDYINFRKLNKVEEFALPSEILRFDYLQSINKIIKDIDVDDLCENSNFKNMLEEVYSKRKMR